MVPKAGFEPACLTAVDFESTAFTNFATSANLAIISKDNHYANQNKINRLLLEIVPKIASFNE